MMWPNYKPSYVFNNLLNFSLKRIVKQESININFYKNCIPFSSGRSAIINILKCYNFQRHAKIAVGPFSNECIYSSTGNVASPILSNQKSNYDAQLIYHQFGYIMRSNLEIFTIEDSVDSYIFSEKGLFPNNGRFEIVSIPKVTNFCFGAIVFCRNQEDYIKLSQYTKILEKSLSLNLFIYLMMFSPNVFDFRKKIHMHTKNLPSKFGDFLLHLINQTENLENKMQLKINEIYNYIDDIPEINKGRYPSSVSLKVDPTKIDEIKKKFPFLYIRTINQSRDFLNWNLIKKIFLPIHQDISYKEIKNLNVYLKNF